MSELGIGSDEPAHEDPPRSYGCLALLITVVVFAALGVFVYVKGVDVVHSMLTGPADFQGTGTGKVVVEVQSGDTATDIASTLYDAGVVKSTGAFIEAAQADPASTSIQVGFYTVHRRMAADEALKLLLDPDARMVNRLTVPEGLRTKQIAALIVDETDFTAREVDRALDDPAALGLPGYAHGDVEGYLFPATYDIAPKSSAADLLAQMVTEFRQRADEARLQAQADRLGISPREAVIIASLVQAEASRLADMPKVASVTYNRLDDGMRLQFDSTSRYAVESLGATNPGNLTDVLSPYNTYHRSGLPPTPIDSPGADALHAALHPASTDYLYFVTVNLKTGETKFATTYAEHQVHVAEYDDYCTTSDAC